MKIPLRIPHTSILLRLELKNAIFGSSSYSSSSSKISELLRDNAEILNFDVSLELNFFFVINYLKNFEIN